jgi:hypothetical protein
MVGLEPFVLARNALSDSHIFAAIIAAINALNSFLIPSSRRPCYAEAKLQLREGEKPGPRLSTGT